MIVPIEVGDTPLKKTAAFVPLRILRGWPD